MPIPFAVRQAQCGGGAARLDYNLGWNHMKAPNFISWSFEEVQSFGAGKSKYIDLKRDLKRRN